MNLPVVILAGGLGTRVQKSFKNTQKCMIKFKGHPFIYYVIENLKKNNIKNVIFLTGYKSYQVEDYINLKYKNSKIKFTFVSDGKSLLGTGGAVKNSLKYVEENFIIINADTYLNYNFNKIIRYYLDKKLSSLITVYKNTNGSDKNNLNFVNGKITYYDKKKNDECNYIDWGMSIFNKKIFKKIKYIKFDMGLIYKKQIRNKRLYGYEVFKKYYEINNPKSILIFNGFLNEKK
jgi:NDP-sugar pyrophosphorylase family protein